MRVFRLRAPASMDFLDSSANAAIIALSFSNPTRMTCGYLCIDGNAFFLFFLPLLHFFPGGGPFQSLGFRTFTFCKSAHDTSVRTRDARPRPSPPHSHLPTRHCGGIEWNARSRLLTMTAPALWQLLFAVTGPCARLHLCSSVGSLTTNKI